GRPRYAGDTAPAQRGQQEPRPPVRHAETPLLRAVRDRRQDVSVHPQAPNGQEKRPPRPWQSTVARVYYPNPATALPRHASPLMSIRNGPRSGKPQIDGFGLAPTLRHATGAY